MLLSTLLTIVIILISFSIHEFAHAWMANRLGDPTARLEGRLTLNPIAHWDPLGTTLLVGLLFLNGLGIPVMAFGWGKPVPVDERYFHNPQSDNLKTSLAGPLSNFLIAFLLSVLLRLVTLSPLIQTIILSSLTINVFLAVFNLLPIPPLDGSRLLRSILPDATYDQLSQFSPLLILGLIGLLFIFPQFLNSIVQAVVSLLLK